MEYYQCKLLVADEVTNHNHIIIFTTTSALQPIQQSVGMRVGVKIAAVAVQVKGACSRSWRMQAASIGINITCIL